MAVSYITLATRSYLPYVSVLADSLKTVDPDGRLVCYLVERTIEVGDRVPSNVDLRPLQLLQLPDRENFYFRYPARELSMALRPYAIAQVLDSDPADFCLYLDSDLYLYQPLEALICESMQGHSVLLTPHLLDPEAETDLPGILRSGIYNSGFIALRNNSNARAFLSWWQKRLARDCIDDPYGGFYVDQRWLDLAVGLFPFIGALRHGGLNVGHWNLHEKSFYVKDGTVYASQDVPLYVYHFSGLTSNRLSRYLAFDAQRIFGVDVLDRLAEDYRARLHERYDSLGPAIPYSFSCFNDGHPIDDRMRELIRCGRVRSERPFGESHELFSSIAEAEWLTIRNERASTRVRDYPILSGKLEQLKNHVVLGRVIRLWQKCFNNELL